MADNRYKLTFTTGSQKNAGTDSDISIKLVGSQQGETNSNQTEFITLNPLVGSSAFEAGSATAITLTSDIVADIGAILEIEIKKDDTGPAPDWLLDKIDVEYYPPGEKPAQSSSFPYHGIIRDTSQSPLRLSHSVDDQPQWKLTSEDFIPGTFNKVVIDTGKDPSGQNFEMSEEIKFSGGVSASQGEKKETTNKVGYEFEGQKGVVRVTSELEASFTNTLSREYTVSVTTEETLNHEISLDVPPRTVGVIEKRTFLKKSTGSISAKSGGNEISQGYEVINGLNGYYKVVSTSIEDLRAGKVSTQALERLIAMDLEPPDSGPGLIKWYAIPSQHHRYIATHTVRKGETLSHIAQKYYKATNRELWTLLHVVNRQRIGPDPNFLSIGWQLKIPYVPKEFHGGHRD